MSYDPSLLTNAHLAISLRAWKQILERSSINQAICAELEEAAQRLERHPEEY